MLLIFILVLAVVSLAIFTGLKLAFLIFLGIIVVGVIVLATLIGASLRLADEADEGHGSLDATLFGGNGHDNQNYE